MAIDNANWLGTVPDGWKIVRIGDCYKLRNEKVSDVEYPPLSVTMKGIVPQLATAAKTDDHDNRKLVRKGDFAINSRSDRRGSCGISDYDGSVSLINTVLTPRDQMNPRYYNWLFHTEQFADEFYKWGHGIVDDLWTTRWQEMKSILIVSPPLSEQQAIADYLDDRCSKIDEIITEATESIEEYKQLKQAVIDQYSMFGVNKDTNTKDTNYAWFTHMPSHWKLVRANRLYKEDVRPAQDGDVSLSLSQVDGLIPTNDMNERSLKTATYDNWKHVIPDDLVLNRFKGHLGVFFSSNYVGMVSFHYGVYHAVRDGVFSKYYEYLFHSTTYKNIFALMSNGITVGLQNLSNSNFYSVKLLLPPFEEQVDIVAHLDKRTAQINSLISEKQSLIEDLKAYKKSLIYEVVTGKRKVV